VKGRKPNITALPGALEARRTGVARHESRACSPDIDGLRKFVRESEHRPAQREVFKRSHLGMWLDSAAEPAFDLTVWDEGRETFDIVKLEGCKAWIGVDLSKVTDLCAVSASIQMPTPANCGQRKRLG